MYNKNKMKMEKGEKHAVTCERCRPSLGPFVVPGVIVVPGSIPYTSISS